MNSRTRIVAVFLSVAVVLAGSSGCSPEWRRKFVRKRAKPETRQAILTLQPDSEAVGPASVRYRERFAYWKSLHTDLLDSLGVSRKRDIRYLDGVIGELGSMSGILTEGPPAQRLRQILAELNRLKAAWNARVGDWTPRSSERTRLEQLRREVDNNFSYAKVKKWIPEQKPQPSHENSESSSGQAQKPKS